jgi:hypothetical protein
MPSSDAADAFLEQAREDLRGAKSIVEQGVDTAPSTLCMLLQQVFEKIAKAARLEMGADFDGISGHKAVTKHLNSQQKFLDTVSRVAKYTKLGNVDQKLRNVIRELEERHPALFRGNRDEKGHSWDMGGQLKYPWRDSQTEEVKYPARDLQLAREIQNPSSRLAANLAKLATAFIERFDDIFG